MIQSGAFYKDFLYKKLKPKSEVLENLLELNEQKLIKSNEIASIYNCSIPSQDDIWICGRILSENVANGGGGKLTEHNVLLQGSYACSNSHTIALNLNNCNEYSLFPGQIVLVNGRNPDGKKFLCKEIIEPNFAKLATKEMKFDENDIYSIQVRLEQNEDLSIIVASGPYMINGSVNTNNLNNLIETIKTQNVHLLVLLGPFLDSNHDLLSTGNIQNSYEELLESVLDEIMLKLKNTKVQVVIQPSLNDITQEPIYPVHPFCLSPKFSQFFHFVREPSMIKVNDILLGITTTDVMKDLTTSTSSKTSSSDKISRNFTHLIKQGSFYPIYPPPDHVCVDYEAWRKYAKIEYMPNIFIAVSDLATFRKDVQNCVCVNPGRLVKGTSTGTYGKIVISQSSKENQENANDFKTNTTVSFHKI